MISAALAGGVAVAGVILYFFLKNNNQSGKSTIQAPSSPEPVSLEQLPAEDDEVNDFTKKLVNAVLEDIDDVFMKLEKEENWRELHEFAKGESDLGKRAREILEKHGKL